jgi:hypothetical protein
MVMVIIIIVWSKQAVLGLLAYESCFKRERGREEHWSMLWIGFFFWLGLVWFGLQDMDGRLRRPLLRRRWWWAFGGWVGGNEMGENLSSVHV